MIQQTILPEKRHYHKKTIASSVKINLPEHIVTKNDIKYQTDLTQYLRNRIITEQDTHVFYQLKYSHTILSKGVIKSILHEYFDNVLSFPEISKRFKMPESMIKQLVNIAYA